MLKYLKNLFVSNKENKKKTVSIVCEWDDTIRAYDSIIKHWNAISMEDQHEDLKAAITNLDNNRKCGLERLKELRQEFIKRNPDKVNSFIYKEMLRHEEEMSVSHEDRYREHMEKIKQEGIIKARRAKLDFMNVTLHRNRKPSSS